ncbi:hypothetical protein [Aidingimonas halophila]|uniref:Uncharacterized protein n=1 Tax=Aidingimonas halophila TaxID=574349 RepID=A0A1H2RI40_9GAMM|nr:hypothetical protein [Aidingimonas halophila]SDW18985.1 hypothetical protein SAMN05443545_101328 [Aidingimonas halophila]
MAGYNAWRVSYQDSEQAAQAAYEAADQYAAQCKRLLDEVALHRADLEEAAGALMMPLPEPGSDIARLMRVNRILKREVEALTSYQRQESEALRRYANQLNPDHPWRADLLIEADRLDGINAKEMPAHE